MVRDFNMAISMNVQFLNELLHEFMARWNLKCLMKYCGLPYFGTFQMELLDKFHGMISPEDVTKYFKRHPLHVDGIEFQSLPKNVKNKKYGMSRLFDRTKATVLAALVSSSSSSSSSSSNSSGDIENEGSGDAGHHEDDDEELNEPDDVFEPEDAEAEHAKNLESETPGPMTTEAEYELFKELHVAMVFPNGQEQNQKAQPVDFGLLVTQFNAAVVQKRKADPALSRVLKLKTKSLLRVAYERMSQSALVREMVSSQLEPIMKLRKMLNDDNGFEFPDVIPMVETTVAEESGGGDGEDEDEDEEGDVSMVDAPAAVDGSGCGGGGGGGNSSSSSGGNIDGDDVGGNGGGNGGGEEEEEDEPKKIDCWNWTAGELTKMLRFVNV